MGLGDWRRLTRAAADLARWETHSIRPLASSLAASPPIPSGYHHDMAETNQTDKLPESPTTTRRPRAIVLGAGDREHVRSQAARLTPQIQQHADVLLVDLEFTEELGGVEADFAVVLGGDGSILRAGRQMGTNQIPVIGVNLGKLGFLAALSPDEFVAVLPDLCAGRFEMVEHLMLTCVLERNGREVASVLGLNEVAVLAGPPFSMLNVDLYVDGKLATTYSCDGLIISTPIGSTAHSLSAGGPILRKNLQAFVISPVSPHTLTVRPVVDTAERIYEMVVPQPNVGTSVVVDGRVLDQVQPNDRVRVERAAARFKMIEVPNHDYYRTLRDKLGWAGNLRMETDRR